MCYNQTRICQKLGLLFNIADQLKQSFLDCCSFIKVANQNTALILIDCSPSWSKVQCLIDVLFKTVLGCCFSSRFSKRATGLLLVAATLSTESPVQAISGGGKDYASSTLTSSFKGLVVSGSSWGAMPRWLEGAF